MNSASAFIFALSSPGCYEPVSSLTHWLGALWFAVSAKALLLKAAGSPGRMAALGVYAASCVLLLSISGYYHFLGPGMERSWMRRLDLAAIFLLIAGTYTPVCAILYRGASRWGSLSIIWAIAVIGIALRTIHHSVVLERIGTGLFLSFGWLGAIFAVELWNRHSFRFVRFLVYGGLAYTIGTVVLEGGSPTLIPGLVRPHELWHIAVLMGMACHWRFISEFAGASAEALRVPQAGLVASRFVQPSYSPEP